MKICPITYQEIGADEVYSKKGLYKLSPQLKFLKPFPHTAEDQRKESDAHSSKLSIQGVQPKLSAALNIKDGVFEIVDKGGRYILKPQVERFDHLPENEDLTMKMATIANIEVPLHGLMYSKDGSLTYFIRRFDRKGQKDKLHVEDFAQLSGASRSTKYQSSMEQVAEIISSYCTFPALEKLKLFERTIFSFLVGNEDMHLKNFSLIVRDEKIELSPAYDLVNSTLALSDPRDELALPLNAKKNKIKHSDLVDYFGVKRLGISEQICASTLLEFKAAIPNWNSLIDRSFLTDVEKQKYREILFERAKRLQLA